MPVLVILAAAWTAVSVPSSTPGLMPVADAPDTATAVQVAGRQGSRVEVAELRTPTRTVYANPDGAMTAELSAVPTRAKRGDRWVPIDTTVETRADKTVGPRAADGELSLSGGGSTAPLARMVKDGRSVALYWPGALPAPRIDGTTVTYPDVLPDVDLVMYAESNGYRQHLLVKSAGAARNAALAKIVFRTETHGLRLSVDNNGALYARDDTGNPVFAAPPSRMWDSSGPIPRRSAAVQVAVQDQSFVLQPDLAMLADPAVVYPIVIDPDMRTWDKNNWASVSSGNRTTAYWWRSAAPDGSTVAQVGQCYNDGTCGGIAEMRAFFQFDTSFLTGRRIMSSVLNSVVVHSPDCSGQPHEVWLTNGQIHPGTTWDNAPNGTTVTGYSAPGVHTNCGGHKPVGIGVINAGGLSTYLLKAANGNNDLAWRKLDPAQTRLTIRYNTGPNQPTGLSTDPPLPTPCRWCDGNPFIGDQFIRLSATLSDPDPGEQVRPKWIIHSNEVPEERWGTPQISGATHDTTIDLRNRNNNWMRWQVQAWDTDNGANLDASTWAFWPGGFIVDLVPPGVVPTVDSQLYPEDNRWHGGMGVPGTFTFGANGVGDIDHYLWGWTSPPTNKVDAATKLSDNATVELTPPGDGPRTLFVQSVDRAGHRSPTRDYRFYVRAENGPLAHWSLDGNAKDSAFLGDRHGTVTGPATWGPGAVDTAMQISQDASTTAPTVVRTDVSFSAQAWVRLDEGTARRVAVSQVDSRAAGFELGYRPEEGGKWMFAMPRTNSDNPTVDVATSAQPAQLNTWTHLAGVHDAKTGQQRLYVNGVLAGTAAHTVKWHASSDSRIGATRWNGSRNHYWRGAIDEVQIYDRPVAESEVKAAVSHDNVTAAEWKFNDERIVNGQPNTTARNSADGGKPGALTNGAVFDGQGAVQLDGVNDHVATSGPAVRTDQSFTVSAWVKPDRLVTGTHMTAVAQLGNRNSAFALEYNSGHNKWAFITTSADSDTSTYGGPVAEQPAVGQWTHLAGVYDHAAQQLRIYVNGQFGQSQPWTSAWHASGPLVIGRGQWRGGPAEHWPGAIDNVRLYSRALSDAEIRNAVIQDNVTTGLWKLDGNAQDASGRNLHGTAHGATWTAGQSTTADPADQAVRLNGSSSYVSAPSAVDPTQSFSVAVWARLEQLRTGAAVISQDAGRVSVFNLHNAWDGRWVFAMRSCDASWNCHETRAVGTEAQAGVWVHLTGTYDSTSGQLAIYVNGVLAGARQYTHTWNHPPGQLLIGRATWGDTEPVDFFPGSIDDVTVYNRPLFADEIRALAGRDSDLIHNWRLDETTGSAADAIGARPGTPNGGATYGPGRVGNAIRLDGTDDVVFTDKVDLRTDQSFTVSAWVYLNGNNCDLTKKTKCVVDAVTVDGNRTSKFRLGHVVDDDQAPHGKWIFEIPESDTDNALVTEAALSVEPGEVGTWVHLAGVYDVQTRRIWLYVNGARVDDGVVNNPWAAAGGLQIGRGKALGAPSGYWPGNVDDVRLYTGAQDKERIRALYRSYPATGN